MKKVAQIVSENKSLFPFTQETTARGSRAKLGKTKRSDEPRNYIREQEQAQAALFEPMTDYRVQRASGIQVQLVQIAHALILCGLPYRSTDVLRIVKNARAANGDHIRVTFHALGNDADGKPIPMAYGSDRTFLHWCIDKAIKLKSPFVPMANAKEFMDEVGIEPTGPNYARLRDAYRRTSSLAIVVERFSKGAKSDEDRAIIPILAHSHLPKSIDPASTPISGQAGIRFGADFFAEANRHHVPFPWDILRTLNKKPQMQDYILFLHWRSFAAKEPSCIPWDRLREQLWQDDSNPRRIRPRFVEAISLLKIAWPELNASADTRGLLIGPPRRGQHLIPAYNGETKLLNHS